MGNKGLDQNIDVGRKTTEESVISRRFHVISLVGVELLVPNLPTVLYDPFSAGINFRRQNLTLKSIPTLKE